MDLLGRAVLDALDRGVAVFDPGGRLVYANPAARRLLDNAESIGASDAKQALQVSGGRAVPLRAGETTIGEAVLIDAGGTLADQERHVILETLLATGGRLAEAARRLGISRTTLWRRLKVYGDIPHAGVHR
jgi:transcriptional regulator of acetoin/glycerol metabolism